MTLKVSKDEAQYILNQLIKFDQKECILPGGIIISREDCEEIVGVIKEGE